jgi:ribose transport system permease protein
MWTERRMPDRRSRLRRVATSQYAGLLLVLVLLVVLFGSITNHFASRVTLITLANQLPALTLCAVGMTLVLIGAGIDLSVGSVLALAACVFAVAVTARAWPLPLALAAAVLAGVIAGLINGWISVRWRIPSFIVTLGMLEMARGGAYLITDSRSVYVGARLDAIGAPIAWLGVSPAFLVAVFVVIAAEVTLTRTVFGRYLVAIGTNREAVRLSGVDPVPVEMAVFTIAGGLAGLAGVLHVAYLETADPNAGTGLELAAIAAVVIGGTSLMGGRGSVVASFLGVLIIAVLQAGLAQAGVSEPLKRIITGVVIIAAVTIDAFRRERQAA